MLYIIQQNLPIINVQNLCSFDIIQSVFIKNDGIALNQFTWITNS